MTEGPPGRHVSLSPSLADFALQQCTRMVQLHPATHYSLFDEGSQEQYVRPPLKTCELHPHPDPDSSTHINFIKFLNASLHRLFTFVQFIQLPPSAFRPFGAAQTNRAQQFMPHTGERVKLSTRCSLSQITKLSTVRTEFDETLRTILSLNGPSSDQIH